MPHPPRGRLRVVAFPETGVPGGWRDPFGIRFVAGRGRGSAHDPNSVPLRMPHPVSPCEPHLMRMPPPVAKSILRKVLCLQCWPRIWRSKSGATSVWDGMKTPSPPMEMRLLPATLAVFAACAAALPAASKEARPNVILCMTDDQGWADVSYNELGRLTEGQFKTVELDKMAAAGLRFDRFYAAAAFCSPTRGSCLTGRNRAPLWGHFSRAPAEIGRKDDRRCPCLSGLPYRPLRQVASQW